MNRVLWTLLRFNLVAQWRHRGLALALAAGLAVGALSLWVGALAVTERQAVMLSVAAPWARMSCVLLTILLTVSVIVRDIQDRSWCLMLAAPLPRWAWLTGTALGLALGGVLNAVLCAWSLWLIQPGLVTLMWSISLALEAILVSALAFAAALALRQVPAAVLASLVFYLAARVMGLIQLLLHRTPFEQSVLQSFSTTLIDGLALLLPRLDAYTLTTWLLPQALGPLASSSALTDPWQLGRLALQTLLYSALALLAAHSDLIRKEVA